MKPDNDLALEEGLLQEWVQEKNWHAIKNRLSSRTEENLTADEWLAGALLLLQEEQPPNFGKAIVCAEHAHAIRPVHSGTVLFLSRLYLRAERLAQALHFARLLVQLSPLDARAWALLGISAHRTKETSLGEQAMAKAWNLASTHLPEDLKRSLFRSTWKYAPFWRSAATGSSLSLAPWATRHADFLTAARQDKKFKNKYHMFQKPGKAAVLKDIEQAQQSPVDSRQIQWVIERRDGTPLGLAALVDIDFRSSRAEGLIGFPEKQSSFVAIEASWLILEFVFCTLQLNRLYAYVYGENPYALSYISNLGFQHEGVLREHVRNPETGQLMDLHLSALLRKEFLSSPKNHLIAKRFLGRSLKA